MRLVGVIFVVLLAVSLMVGCGQKAEEGADKAPVEVKQAEAMDSTRMDSAMIDSAAAETMEAAPDSM